MRNLFIMLLFCQLGSEEAQAQKGENVYAAPGMPIILAHRLPSKIIPTIKPWLTQPLPRFWESVDAMAQQQELWQFRQALAQRVHYPKLALASQLGGTVQVRILVAPSGTPLAASIVGSALTLDLPDKKTGEALQIEALRVAQLLRFQPKIGLIDTVIFPVTYLIQ